MCHREKIVRGLKHENLVILSGLRLYHNHVRPYLGLSDSQTLDEAAGITIESGNRWKTLIQATARAESGS